MLVTLDLYYSVVLQDKGQNVLQDTNKTCDWRNDWRNELSRACDKNYEFSGAVLCNVPKVLDLIVQRLESSRPRVGPLLSCFTTYICLGNTTVTRYPAFHETAADIGLRPLS